MVHEEAAPIPPTKRSVDVALITLFLTVIFLPLVDLAFDIDPTQFDERAELEVDPPAPTLASLRESWELLQRMMGKRFGFRGALIRGHGLYKVRALGKSSTPKVVLGEDDWLFLAEGDILGDHQGLVPLERDALERIERGLARTKTQLEQRGAKFLFVVAPNKHSIYPEFLPERYRHRIGEATRLDQVAEALSPATPFVDLRAPLLAAKGEDAIYYKSDSHWNERGAYAGYRALAIRIRQLGLRLPLRSLIRLDELSIRNAEGPGGGTARMLGLKYDTIEPRKLVAHPIRSARAVGAIPLPDDQLGAGRFRLMRLESDDAPLGRLLVFHDSFGPFLIPYLSEHFRESVFIWTHNVDMRIVEREKPDLVIQLVVERRSWTGWFSNEKPAEDAVRARSKPDLRAKE